MPKRGREIVRTVTVSDECVQMVEWLASLDHVPVKRRMERMIRKSYHQMRRRLAANREDEATNAK